MNVEQFLQDASDNAVGHIAQMKALYLELKILDEQTNNICLRFLNDKTLEPVERQLMAEQLVVIQQCRAFVVAEAMALGRNI